MKIVSLDTIDSLSLTGSVVSVGNFDGVHRGHELLIKTVVERAHQLGVVSIIVTFDPHTRLILNKRRVQPVLSTLDEKAVLLALYGVDYLVCIPFNATFAALSPDVFVENILIGSLKAREWVMGERHTFGKNQAGNKKFAHSSKGKNDIITLTVKSLVTEQTIISSTTIRASLRHGHITEAVNMLGHPYLIVSQRIAGVGKGTQLGYPTLNFSLQSSHKVLPPSGVYAAELEYKGKRWQGALYFGDCPTFGQRDIHFEFHVFNYSDDIPNNGDIGNLWLYTMVRPDKKFLSSDELIENIRKDVKDIQKFFLQEKEQCR